MADPTVGELFKAKAILEADVAAIDAFMSDDADDRPKE